MYAILFLSFVISFAHSQIPNAADLPVFSGSVGTIGNTDQNNGPPGGFRSLGIVPITNIGSGTVGNIDLENNGQGRLGNFPPAVPQSGFNQNNGQIGAAGFPVTISQNNNQGIIGNLPVIDPQNGQGGNGDSPSSVPQANGPSGVGDSSNVGQGGNENVPNSVPQDIGQGDIRNLPTTSPVNNGQTDIASFPITVSQNNNQGTLGNLPLINPQNNGQGGIGNLPSSVPQDNRQGGIGNSPNVGQVGNLPNLIQNGPQGQLLNLVPTLVGDESGIERPCQVFDIYCIRRYFKKNGRCKEVRGPVPEPYFRAQSSAQISRLNATFSAFNILYEGLNGRVIEFYINRRTDKLVLSIEFRNVTFFSRDVYYRFYRRGREPITTYDYLYLNYQSYITTTIIPELRNLQLYKSETTTFTNDAIPAFSIGPNAFNYPDPAVQSARIALLANIPVVVQEAQLTEGPFSAATFIQNNICDFKLNVL